MNELEVALVKRLAARCVSSCTWAKALQLCCLGKPIPLFSLSGSYRSYPSMVFEGNLQLLTKVRKNAPQAIVAAALAGTISQTTHVSSTYSCLSSLHTDFLKGILEYCVLYSRTMPKVAAAICDTIDRRSVELDAVSVVMLVELRFQCFCLHRLPRQFPCLCFPQLIALRRSKAVRALRSLLHSHCQWDSFSSLVVERLVTRCIEAAVWNEKRNFADDIGSVAWEAICVSCSVVANGAFDHLQPSIQALIRSTSLQYDNLHETGTRITENAVRCKRLIAEIASLFSNDVPSPGGAIDDTRVDNLVGAEKQGRIMLNALAGRAVFTEQLSERKIFTVTQFLAVLDLYAQTKDREALCNLVECLRQAANETMDSDHRIVSIRNLLPYGKRVAVSSAIVTTAFVNRLIRFLGSSISTEGVEAFKKGIVNDALVALLPVVPCREWLAAVFLTELAEPICLQTFLDGKDVSSEVDRLYETIASIVSNELSLEDLFVIVSRHSHQMVYPVSLFAFRVVQRVVAKHSRAMKPKTAKTLLQWLLPAATSDPQNLSGALRHCGDCKEREKIRDDIIKLCKRRQRARDDLEWTRLPPHRCRFAHYALFGSLTQNCRMEPNLEQLFNCWKATRTPDRDIGYLASRLKVKESRLRTLRLAENIESVDDNRLSPTVLLTTLSKFWFANGWSSGQTHQSEIYQQCWSTLLVEEGIQRSPYLAGIQLLVRHICRKDLRELVPKIMSLPMGVSERLEIDDGKLICVIRFEELMASHDWSHLTAERSEEVIAHCQEAEGLLPYSLCSLVPPKLKATLGL